MVDPIIKLKRLLKRLSLVLTVLGGRGAWNFGSVRGKVQTKAFELRPREALAGSGLILKAFKARPMRVVRVMKCQSTIPNSAIQVCALAHHRQPFHAAHRH